MMYIHVHRTTKQTYIHIHKQSSNHNLIHIHINILMHRYCYMNTKLSARSEGYSNTYTHIYTYTYIHTYHDMQIHIYKYIILYKCTSRSLVLTLFLIPLSAPWPTRYSTISLCPLRAASIIAVSPYWS